MAELADIGVLGLAVMGANLARNAARKGFGVALYNRHADRTDALVKEHGGEGRFLPAKDARRRSSPRSSRRVRSSSWSRPGAPVDEVIDELIPHLDPGDIVIDGGNSQYTDTNRRAAALKEKGFRFVGMGVSGGEEGALLGPSMMPGGEREAYSRIEPIVRKMAAQVDGTPCVTYIGPEGAGHYVKMVHNGIEYADMQLIAEAYDLLKSVYGLAAEAIADIFEEWKKGDLDSYLIEITAEVLRKKDSGGGALVDKIVDEAEQKGTGRWAVQSALDLGVPLTAITEAVFARALSARREQRIAAEKIIAHAATSTRKPSPADIDAIRDALYASKIVAYAQGFEEMAVASQEFGWDLKLGELAMIWRGGCIIRARLLHRIREAFEADAAAAEPSAASILPRCGEESRAELAQDAVARGGKRRADAGLLLDARLLRRHASRARAGQPAAGPPRLFRRAHLCPSRQAGKIPHPLGAGRQRGRDRRARRMMRGEASQAS